MARDKDYQRIVRERQDNYAVRIDKSTSPYIYIGKAAVGNYNNTSQSVWQISRFDKTASNGLAWAGADDSFNQIWDNRASLSYGG